MSAKPQQKNMVAPMDPAVFSHLAWISDKYRSRHDERRKYETQYVISTLAVLLAGAAGLSTSEARIPESAVPLIYVFALTLAATTSIFLWSIHAANRCDIEKSEAAEDAIRAHYAITPTHQPPSGMAKWRNLVLQALCLVATAVTAAAFAQLSIVYRASFD